MIVNTLSPNSFWSTDFIVSAISAAFTCRQHEASTTACHRTRVASWCRPLGMSPKSTGVSTAKKWRRAAQNHHLLPRLARDLLAAWFNVARAHFKHQLREKCHALHESLFTRTCMCVQLHSPNSFLSTANIIHVHYSIYVSKSTTGQLLNLLLSKQLTRNQRFK